ncbi:MAG: cyclopropane-fatty-acyl-phospholipid synthase family protein [Sedimenticolaceae bacterium]
MSVDKRDTANTTPGAQGVVGDRFPSQTSLIGGSLSIERHLLQWVLERLGRAPLCFVLWDGTRVSPSGVVPECDLHISDRGALWRLMGHPEYQFPEMYVQGRVGLGDDLERVLRIVQQARLKLDPNSLTRRLLSALFRRRSGSLARARENIHSHYDLGNDFYRLWLDEQMVYTCAYFETQSTSLEDAQKAKMDRVCRKLRLRSGERVVEAGCGWGALALHMARHFGVKVRAFNISRSQLEFARERAAREGLDDVVEFVEGDYREIVGNYDAFVSVGMLEHVGPQHYPELGRILDRTLPVNGRGLIHTIGTDRPGPLNTWIERRIFPGACPPSLGEMMPLFGPSHFSILDVENIRLHYALTLRHWLQRFYASQDKVLEMFDQEFVRAWRFYLVSSETAFTTGHLQLFQVLFARKGSNDIPWTRAYLEDSGCP